MHPHHSDDVDPVALLLQEARNEAIEPQFRVTGVMMQYYEACPRELWFESRNIEIDRTNPNIVRGTQVDDTAYQDTRRRITIDGVISPDMLEDGRIVEVKPSSAITEPAKLQLLYYLWYLDRVVGFETTGVLAHPSERRREEVTLTDETVDRVESAIRDIYDIVAKDSPPEATEKSYCESCAYHDFCWS